MQNFGVTNKEYYGMLWSFLEWSMITTSSETQGQSVGMGERARRKELRRNFSPIGHNNIKHFLCPIRRRHPVEFLEIVRL